MEPKTSEWRPGPTVCRCCLTEGCYKDISTEYFWMGKREVYSEMLSETFSVSISYSKSGGPNSQSRLICEQCISRLRDAADFKRQVVECEKMFMQHLDPGTSSVVEFSVPQVESSEKVKLERVKVEKVASDDDFDDGGFPDDDDDDDDLDDQPLMKLASKIPKKESLDLRDLLDNTKLVLKRKAPPTSKTKPVVPTKKLKSKKEVKPAPSKAKAVAKPAPKPVEKKKKEFDMTVEARCNAKILLRYASVYPFRIPSNDMVCVFCGETHSDPQIYRKHMQTEHNQFKVNTAFFHTASNFEYLKVDCTEIKCKICKEPFEDLQSVAEHLVRKHGKAINLDAELGMQVFKLGEEKWVCAFCKIKVPSLRDLSRHTSKHYHKFTCELCGRSYVNKESLTKHIATGHVEGKVCLKCKKMFPSCKARREHMEETRRCWPYICTFCGERFLSKKLKTEHLSTVHGEQKKSNHTCPECGQVFDKWRAYRVHFVITHTEHNYECPFCGIKFDTLRSYESHKVVHTKEKTFACTFCPKAFGRKKNLIQHMWIHSEHKRFECKMCNKQFNQRVSWKTHMKSYHPELVDF